MFSRWKLWYARRQLALAIREEEQQRRYAEHLKNVTIPLLEANLKAVESEVLFSDFFKGK